MTDRYFVLARGVLGLRVNRSEFKWSFGINAPTATEAEYGECRVRVRLVIDDSMDPAPATPNYGKYHYFSGVAGAGHIHYERTLMLGRQLRLELSGVSDDEPTLRVNSSYLRWVTHRFMNLHSPGYILTDLASLLLLRAGYSPIHCSGFHKGDASVAVLAPPNTGKTLSTMMACMEHGADFIAEDLAITDGRDIISVPWTSTFRYYSNIDDSLGSRIRKRLTDAIPLTELVPASTPKRVTTFLGDDRVVHRAKVTHLILLERGPEGIRIEDPKDVTRKAINLNRYEFNYIKAPALVAYEYFNPTVNGIDAFASEQRILSELVDNVAHRIVISTTDPLKYAGMMMDAIARYPAPSV